MALTKVTAGVIAANAVTDSFGTQSITGDKIGLNAITGNTLASNIINANNIVNGTITSAKIDTVANTQLTGTISATQIAANSVNATILQTNSVENYMATSGRPLSNRNLIINGAMQVAQRNTSVAGITTTGYYTADRMQIGLSSAGTWTMNVESSAPDDTEFRRSANLICTTADSSLSAGDVFVFTQRIEGQNLQGIKKGTVSAESLTISFYVKSSNTGTYICEFFDNDNTRQISKSYTINSANTWEKKTITIPPDTTGQFDNDNAESLALFFWLAAGTTFSSGTLNSSTFATSVNANRAVGQLNLANLSGNYWAVTGTQLETGTVATPFEVRNIGDELSLCQRYYQKYTALSGNYVAFGSGRGSGGTTVFCYFKYTTPVRATPTLTQSNTGINNPSQVTVTGFSSVYYGSDGAGVELTTGSITGSGVAFLWVGNNNSSAYVDISAEL